MSSECVEKPKLGDRVHRINVLAEAEDDAPICWVCLDHATLDKPLIHPCKCPSWCHSTCIARWQLQSAGTRREKFCDFCSSELPDWKSVLTPVPGATAPAVMNVNFDNKTYSFQVAPGADGYRQFTEAIRKAFHLPEDSELNITFTCDEPSSGSLLTLSGPGAYDAAVHCASVSAARRSLSGDSNSSSSSGADSPMPEDHDTLQQQQHPQQRSGVGGFGSFVGGGDVLDGAVRDDQQSGQNANSAADGMVPPHAASTTAAAAPVGREGGLSVGYQDGVQRSAGSNSSSQSYGRDLSRSFSNRSDSGASSMAAESMLYSPATSSSSQQHQEEMQDVQMPTAGEPTAAAATHYDPSASPPESESGRISMSSMDDDLGSDCNAAAAGHGECSRTPSTASSSTSMGGRRGSGFGKKLRDVISDLLVSK